MPKQFDLSSIEKKTITEKMSSMPLKFKKVFEDVVCECKEKCKCNAEVCWCGSSDCDCEKKCKCVNECVCQKSFKEFVVGLPTSSKDQDSWEEMQVRMIRVATQVRPIEKKYPVLLNYDTSDIFFALLVIIDEKTYVVSVEDDKVLLKETSEELISQNAIFSTKSGRLVHFNDESKCLYWNIDNEFKLIDKDTKDFKLLEPVFVFKDVEDKEKNDDTVAALQKAINPADSICVRESPVRMCTPMTPIIKPSENVQRNSELDDICAVVTAGMFAVFAFFYCTLLDIPFPMLYSILVFFVIILLLT